MDLGAVSDLGALRVCDAERLTVDRGVVVRRDAPQRERRGGGWADGESGVLLSYARDEALICEPVLLEPRAPKDQLCTWQEREGLQLPCAVEDT